MKNDKCAYGYKEACECREDDNCGCTYPNNMHNDTMCNNVYMKGNPAKTADDAEKTFNQSKNEETFMCPVCGASAKDCACEKK